MSSNVTCHPNIDLARDAASHSREPVVPDRRAVRKLFLGISNALFVNAPLCLPVRCGIGRPVRQLGKGIRYKKWHCLIYEINDTRSTHRHAVRNPAAGATAVQVLERRFSRVAEPLTRAEWVNTTAFERSRSHGRRYACLLVAAFSSTRLRSRCRRGNLSGRCSTFGCSQ